MVVGGGGNKVGDGVKYVVEVLDVVVGKDYFLVGFCGDVVDVFVMVVFYEFVEMFG